MRAALAYVVTGLTALLAAVAAARAGEPAQPQWLWSTAYAIPRETTNQGSGYFSIVEGHNGRLYVGTAKYGVNAYLVEFDPEAKQFRIAVDCHREIGTDATGFAAQAKIHTRNNVGASGRIYFGTKQGYPEEGEQRTDYPGGYPLVYDPATGKTRVYPIAVPHHGVISVAPDESRGVAYVSTCSDERPIESTHFLVLDLETGQYRDLLDCRHMYAFIVVDHRGRAYHPILGGQIARYDPETGRLERLRQTIDGAPLPAFDRDAAGNPPAALLAHPESHPVNWDLSPDRRTLYAVAMSGNELFAYDLAAPAPAPAPADAADTLAGRSLGPLVAGADKTDCRALRVGPDGTVWAGVNATFADGAGRAGRAGGTGRAGRGDWLHVVSWRPGDAQTTDHGPLAIRNPDYTSFTDESGQPLPWHHGVHRPVENGQNGPLLPRYTVMGLCATRAGRVYVTTLAPFTLHEVEVGRAR